MFKDLWEFLDEKVKARIIFGSILALIVLVLIVPYVISVVGHNQSNSEMSTAITDPVEPASTEVPQDDTELSESAEVAELSASEADSEPASEPEPESEPTYAYVYTTPASSNPTTQPTSQPAPTPSPAETPRGTTIDDRGSSDDGYTASGIDDQSSEEPTLPEAPTDSSEI